MYPQESHSGLDVDLSDVTDGILKISGCVYVCVAH